MTRVTIDWSKDHKPNAKELWQCFRYGNKYGGEFTIDNQTYAVSFTHTTIPKVKNLPDLRKMFSEFDVKEAWIKFRMKEKYGNPEIKYKVTKDDGKV